MVFKDRSLAPYRGSEPYLFLSYSHRDAGQAESVIRALKSRGFRVWYDEGLTPGKEWDENIANTIMACGYFIVLMSSHYLASANCRDELNYARDKSKPLLLMYLEEVKLPAGMELRLGRLLAIRRYQYTDEARIYDKILRADGIEICREAGAASPALTGEERRGCVPPPDKTWRRRVPTAVRIVLPLLLATVLALVLWLRVKKQEAPVSPAPPAAETEAPFEAELPVEPEAPLETEVPFEPEAPAAAEVPFEPEVPLETEVPAESVMPVESEAPPESSPQAETEAPGEIETPNENGAPPEEAVPAFKITKTPETPRSFLRRDRPVVRYGSRSSPAAPPQTYRPSAAFRMRLS